MVRPLHSFSMDTRQRIIEAAGEIFASHGYQGATVRQITERAGVNLAAINYHFGDKAELYAEVLSVCRCSAQEIDALPWPESAPPEEQVRFFIERLVRRLMNPERPKWHRLVFTREMLDPTGVLDRLAKEKMCPEQAQLCAALGQLTGGQLPERELHKLSFSIAGQCLFYMQNGPLIELLSPPLKGEPATVEEIIDHVHRFSLAALKQWSTALSRHSSGLEISECTPVS